MTLIPPSIATEEALLASRLFPHLATRPPCYFWLVFRIGSARSIESTAEREFLAASGLVNFGPTFQNKQSPCVDFEACNSSWTPRSKTWICFNWASHLVPGLRMEPQEICKWMKEVELEGMPLNKLWSLFLPPTPPESNSGNPALEDRVEKGRIRVPLQGCNDFEMERERKMTETSERSMGISQSSVTKTAPHTPYPIPTLLHPPKSQLKPSN